MDLLTYYVRNDPVILTVMLDHAITVAESSSSHIRSAIQPVEVALDRAADVKPEFANTFGAAWARLIRTRLFT